MTHRRDATRDGRAPRPRQPRVSVVVPALNEAANLRTLLPALPPVHEVLVVDGDSVDGTPAAARAALPGVRTVAPARRGKGHALAAGLAEVTGDVVVALDADGSVDPGELPRFVAALVGGADVVAGPGCHAFWVDLAPLLGLPDADEDAPDAAPRWGDGAEVETLLTHRLAAAGCTVTRLPDVGSLRRRAPSRVPAPLHGLSERLRAHRTLRTERAHQRRG